MIIKQIKIVIVSFLVSNIVIYIDCLLLQLVSALVYLDLSVVDLNPKEWTEGARFFYGSLTMVYWLINLILLNHYKIKGISS